MASRFEGETVLDAGDIEEPLYLLRATPQNELMATGFREAKRLDQDREAGAVHELKPAEVDQNARRSRLLSLMKRALEVRPGGEVEVADEGENRPAAVSGLDDSKPLGRSPRRRFVDQPSQTLAHSLRQGSVNSFP
jgi:hypothetical protein